MVRKVNDDIGFEQLVFAVAKTSLHGVFLTLTQAGFFQDSFQDKLSPVSLSFFIAPQCPGQVDCLFVDLLIEFP